MTNREQLAWAAGFFEGEGCISLRKTSRFIAINNTDRACLEHFYKAIGGVGRLRGPYGPYNNGISKKPYWTWSASNFEHRQAVIAMLWPWMSLRRREQLRQVIKY